MCSDYWRFDGRLMNDNGNDRHIISWGQCWLGRSARPSSTPKPMVVPLAAVFWVELLCRTRFPQFRGRQSTLLTTFSFLLPSWMPTHEGSRMEKPELSRISIISRLAGRARAPRNASLGVHIDMFTLIYDASGGRRSSSRDKSATPGMGVCNNSTILQVDEKGDVSGQTGDIFWSTQYNFQECWLEWCRYRTIEPFG